MRKGITAGVLTAALTLGLAWPASAGIASNHAYAHTGGHRTTDVNVQWLVASTPHAHVVANNTARATSADCSNCRTTAISVAIDLMTTDRDVIAIQANNTAGRDEHRLRVLRHHGPGLPVHRGARNPRGLHPDGPGHPDRDHDPGTGHSPLRGAWESGCCRRGHPDGAGLHRGDDAGVVCHDPSAHPCQAGQHRPARHRAHPHPGPAGHLISAGVVTSG